MYCPVGKESTVEGSWMYHQPHVEYDTRKRYDRGENEPIDLGKKERQFADYRCQLSGPAMTGLADTRITIRRASDINTTTSCFSCVHKAQVLAGTFALKKGLMSGIFVPLHPTNDNKGLPTRVYTYVTDHHHAI